MNTTQVFQCRLIKMRLIGYCIHSLNSLVIMLKAQKTMVLKTSWYFLNLLSWIVGVFLFILVASLPQMPVHFWHCLYFSCQAQEYSSLLLQQWKLPRLLLSRHFTLTNCSKMQCAKFMPYVKRHSFSCMFKANTVQCVNGQRKPLLVHFTRSVLCEPQWVLHLTF